MVGSGITIWGIRERAGQRVASMQRVQSAQRGEASRQRQSDIRFFISGGVDSGEYEVALVRDLLLLVSSIRAAISCSVHLILSFLARTFDGTQLADLHRHSGSSRVPELLHVDE